MNIPLAHNRGLLSRRLLRQGTLLGAALLVAPLFLASASAFALPAPTPLAAETESAPCQMTGGTLTWGVKESFRSYISGSIANGSWDATDGASYTTPEFQWANATGSVDLESGTGSVSFTGTVHFTGHEGVLDLTLMNPTIEFEGEGKASLLLDARGTDASGKLTIDAKQVRVGEVTAPFPVSIVDETINFDQMKTVLTDSGAQAFAGFYEPGATLDPVTVALHYTGCEVPKMGTGRPTETPATPTPTATPGAEADTEIPWMLMVVGGIAVLVIGVTSVMLFSGRKRSQSVGDDAAASRSPHP